MIARVEPGAHRGYGFAIAAASGVRLSSGDLVSAGAVVNAAGAWAGALGATRGPRAADPAAASAPVPLRAAANSWPYRFPMVIDPTGVHWRHDDPDHVSDLDRIVVARTYHDEPFGENFECEANAGARLPAAARASPARARRIVRVIEGWAGLYEVTPDHNPVIGEHPALEGFYVAAGFSGHGLMMSPAIGRVMTEIIRTGHADHRRCVAARTRSLRARRVFHDGAMI